MKLSRGVGGLLIFLSLCAGAARSAELAWVELLTSGAPADLAPFYEKTFGWTSERAGEGARGAVVFLRAGRPVAGAVHRAGERMGQRRSRWVGFWSVSDLGAAEAAVNSAGGRVFEATHAGAAQGARQGLMTDADGAVYGVIAADESGGRLAAAKGFWPVLMTRNPGAAVAFYRNVLGGEAREEMRTPLFAGDFLLGEGERVWAGVQPNGVDGRAGWLLLIAVADIDAATAAARREGARVLRAPMLDLIGGRVAVLADPFGGVFGLYEALPVAARGKAKTSRGAATAGDYEVEALSR